MPKRKSHYEVLGVDQSASPDEIKQARRRKSIKAHPDKGGDQNEMAEINHAFDVLSNPARRQLYDATGQDSQKPFEEEVHAVLKEAFIKSLQDDAPNCLAYSKGLIRAKRDEIQKQKAHLLTVEKRLQAKRDKISVKSGENLFQSLIDSELHGIAQAMAQFDHYIQLREAALKALENYASSEEAMEVMQTYTIRTYGGQIIYDGR